MDANDNPQVFLLSGWGEPGSATSEDDSEQEKDGNDRRFWTCWCAAHRPPMRHYATSNSGDNSQSYTRNLIILELELERDLYNPLYPPFQQDLLNTGSPDSQASSHSSSMGSGSSTATTFSRGSGSTTEMNVGSPDTNLGSMTPIAEVASSSVPTESTSDASSDSLVPSTSTSRNTKPPPVLNPAELFLSSKQGLEGGEQWFPAPEDVFESTTSHSKPLKALERMRRINRTFTGPNIEGTTGQAGGPGASNSGTHGARQRARARRGGSQAGIGTMDIFAVLAQVNEQLSSAPTLESFLKVVVGVIKDLTQFHRVLLYQFDDHWNGQVVSELVDWRQTHDLYKGLHFPASDIPAQVKSTSHAYLDNYSLLVGSRIV